MNLPSLNSYFFGEKELKHNQNIGLGILIKRIGSIIKSLYKTKKLAI